ncbi:tRNA pseudouridine(38-40) synthase TruA [Dermatophilus congolensis]|uniref:tRNA pseudouridine(38-40) synthase TruA n=1 Tax=Dermatophilus congolensis TaxID=1863 RepID=UPI001AAE8CE5|nr:tRNA pseudouridine(38-40) synthase TruA [Dermatophilus congolensis]MBO3129740.1 tRNA pseudouridine(38-40) synthase TruA [Dermatophilus congolensis]MBO3131630.1 tRNA pseudouridine(38-40) synthase TruA [Dermatophilus congolensis]MBO3134214.1 tRNA pseudouridine(38-40) synthase TruA [Dermatophilus congolensis]MBO3136447.1 tRNA pseudouridine(38-40) synthase TruA [Dermatophilus congolensis]MBO3138696.1 tRNA pseudouridine(38-40) synthase TruA [Dermatophilus congolensis]
MRLRIDFAYDGTAFSGWAKQPGLRTVEGELTTALEKILRHDVRLVVAGRTDAGVHARGSVLHVDVEESAFHRLPGRSQRTPEAAAVTRLAAVLPADIVVRKVQQAPAGFDARFSALSRRYSYTLTDEPSELDPLQRHGIVVHKRQLDVSAMHLAAQQMLGLHDFAAYCKPREGATTIRNLLAYEWERRGPLVIGTIIADAFCHSMVRALVGGVVPVGEGKQTTDWPALVLGEHRRNPAVTVMPPHGLCLEEVRYPADHQLSARAAAARCVRQLPE